MHPCLNVDEILRLIACELVASKAKATAVALACCCERFEGPMLDALWETQIELFPLLKTLPRDVWNPNGRFTFKRLPTALEWARLRKYSGRMRKLEELGGISILSSEALSVLQHCAIGGPLFPNMRTLRVWPNRIDIPFIPLFLSSKTTAIEIMGLGPKVPKLTVASMITTFSTLCPSLQEVALPFLPRHPMVTTAVSGMLLASNRNTLRRFHVDSTLTEEARQAVCNLPNLRHLSVVIEKDSSLPLVTLPKLTNLAIKCDEDSDLLRVFHGATFGKLETVTFHSKSKQIENLLEAFERIAVAESVQDTLSEFRLHTSCSWDPNYSSLLPFRQLKVLIVEPSCHGGCSSTVDDDVITNLARAMPSLVTLKVDDEPCREILNGPRSKVDSLSHPPAISGAGTTALRGDCALRDLDVGETPVPEVSVSTVALTLAYIFPRIEWIDCVDENSDWHNVISAIRDSRRIINHSSTILGSAI